MAAALFSGLVLMSCKAWPQAQTPSCAGCPDDQDCVLHTPPTDDNRHPWVRKIDRFLKSIPQFDSPQVDAAGNIHIHRIQKEKPCPQTCVCDPNNPAK